MKLFNNITVILVLVFVPLLCIAQQQSSYSKELGVGLSNSELFLDRDGGSKLLPLDSLYSSTLKLTPFEQSQISKETPQVLIPIVRDFSSEGLMWRGRLGAVVGVSSMTTYYGMGGTVSADMLYILNINDKWTLSFGAYASKYTLMNIHGDNFGISGSAHYYINNYLRLNLFGAYYTQGVVNNRAVAPFLRTSYYGGSLSIEGRKIGVDLGAQNIYNAFSGQWDVLPIVMPKVKLGNANAWIGIDVGGVIKNAVK